MSSADPHSGERPRRQYAFADFTLDLDRGFLLRDGVEISLRPKSLEVLVYLVERQGRLVSRDELIRAVWPDVAVADESVTKCIAEIRKALNDDAQQLVRTVARRGYLFAIPVTAPVLEFPRPQLETRGATAQARHRSRLTLGAMAVAAVVVLTVIGVWRAIPPKQELAYEQLTNFTDSAVSPALSPDGKMLAFLRSDQWFLSTGQIYVKLLPKGESLQLTHDTRPKYGPGFSPDGTRIVYTVFPWSTYVVSPLGGEPALFLKNSSGVTWLRQNRILFSEMAPHSVRMGMVTANEDRSEQRTIYFPQDQRGMVHLSYPSPDRKWAIALEMNPLWQPCRVIPLDASSSGYQVGPKGNCTSAAWSPDGKWMYFGVEVDSHHHLWRQKFPKGQPEQLTSGLTEEDGIAVAPDGRSLITSIGAQQGALWIHDARGERALSAEGDVPNPEARGGAALTVPVFSRDGKMIFYLSSASRGAPRELWQADLASGKTARALAGVAILEFDVSDDLKEVVYSTHLPGKPSQIWIANLDRSSPPQRVSSDGGEFFPHFGREGRIVYQRFNGSNRYMEQMNRDGSGRTRLVSYPVGDGIAMSPDRRWITTSGTIQGRGGTFAVPLDGGAPQWISAGTVVTWEPDGRYLYVQVQGVPQVRAIPLPPGRMLPNLPLEGGILIDAFPIFPGPDPSLYAYVKTTTHRNLFRIPLRD